MNTSIRMALVGGLVAAIIIGAVAVTVGRVSGIEAARLLEATIPTTRFLCSGIMTASATILALMLTLLGVSSSTDPRLVRAHYTRIRQIALGVVVSFIIATALLVSLVLPFGENLEIDTSWYVAIYYGVVSTSAILSGILVTVMILLYSAVRDIIDVFQKGQDAGLVQHEDRGDDQ